ncbi:hypothetical protein HAX54_012943 [Datura stramonium]|uniref:Uncharacterized protein n=1 Tax=Datura stramonium TaxID=4076 RepID=A0ABS8TMD5_DATST|nr:hypothetical protein [Datura stramonium]
MEDGSAGLVPLGWVGVEGEKDAVIVRRVLVEVRRKNRGKEEGREAGSWRGVSGGVSGGRIVRGEKREKRRGQGKRCSLPGVGI